MSGTEMGMRKSNKQFSEAIIKTEKSQGGEISLTEIVLISLGVGTYCGVLCDVYTTEMNG